MAGYYSFPPATAWTLPWAHGTVVLALPNDPALSGLDLLLQALTIGAGQGPAAAGNSQAFRIR